MENKVVPQLLMIFVNKYSIRYLIFKLKHDNANHFWKLQKLQKSNVTLAYYFKLAITFFFHLYFSFWSKHWCHSVMFLRNDTLQYLDSYKLTWSVTSLHCSVCHQLDSSWKNEGFIMTQRRHIPLCPMWLVYLKWLNKNGSISSLYYCNIGEQF